MADKIFHSSAVTFVDMTDERKLEIYISSNHPTVQLCNANKTPLEYTPDWSVNNLKLDASFYLDSAEITPETIGWYTKIGTRETLVGSLATLSISTNVLVNDPIITYICKAKYQNIEALKEITFTRVDTGLNGANAPAIQAQHSADGSTNWTSTLNTATHKYIRYSYDGGKTWTTAIKMVGEDGTSVVIKGTAYTPDALVAGQTVKLYSDSSNTTAINTSGLSTGDSYLVSGYLCVYNEDNISFVCTGTIQGPKGSDGVSSYVFIRYATDASGTGMSTNPSGKTYMGVYTSNTNTAPTTPNSYTWSKFVGESAKSIILSGDSQVFKINQNNEYVPSSIKVTAQKINIPTTTSLTWSYNVNDNKGWTAVAPNGVTINGDVVTIVGETLTANSVVIKASDGTVEDIFTVYKAFDGSNGDKGDAASIAFLTNENVSFSANANGVITAPSITTNVVAYNGTTKQMPTLGDITPPNGMIITKKEDALLNEMELAISFVAGTNLGTSASTSGTITIPITSPVVTNLKLSWSKINSGAKGDKGDKGGDAYTVMLTNEAHTFAGDVDHAYASSVTTQILGYKGATQQSVTIQSVGGTMVLADDTDYTINDISGLTFRCSASEITFTCTESFKTASGTLPIVILVDGQQFTRMFSYSIAFKGATGGTGTKGDTGSPATAYWLVSSASAVQKTSTGTITVTPSTLTFTGKSKTGTSAPINYGCRWIIAYSTDGTNYTDLYTSTANEAIKSVAVATTYKTIRARMYLAGGTTTLLDEQIIPVVSDGEKGDKGDTGNTGRGVSSIVEQYYQSTSATSQTEGSWSTTVPAWVDGKYIWTRSVITYTDSTTSTTSPICVTGQKGGTGGTGVGVSSVDVWYYQSTSATALSGGSWSTTAPTWADGKYIWTKTITTYTNNTTDETSAVCITGQKGSTGVGIKSVTEYYLATSSSSGVAISTTGWTTTIQTITVDKKYLWNYEIITYTDNTTSTTTPIIIGVFGSTGKGIKSVTEYYLATASSSGVTTSTTGWTTTMQTLTATNKYLWNYELITYTDNTTATINPVIIGVYGDKGNQGDPGVGISSVTVTYGTSTSTSAQPTSWQATIPTVTEGSYLWTRTITDYTDSSMADTVTYTYAKQGKTPIKGTDYVDGTSVTVSSIQYQASTSATTAPTGTWSNSVVTVAEGSYLWTKTTFSDGKVAYGVAKQGQKGSDAYTVILTNESHIFAGTVSAAVASSATTQVLAYKGGSAQSVTIVSVNGKTASTSSTATGIAGLSFTCSALSGNSPTITFTCTTSFVSASGAIPIVLTVDGVTITKMFTYGIAFKGTIGTPASLVDITPSAHYFKSTTGKDGTFTPDYIYLYPRFQTVTYSKWEYSVNGGTTWVAASGANGLSISTYNSVANTLRIARTSTLYTDTVTSISFRCVSSNSSVYDTVSIAKIYDVVDLEMGVTFQLYAPKGYLITNETPEVTLQTFAYEGAQSITNATFKWYTWSGEVWTELSGVTGTSLTINKTNVMKTSVYKCEMTYDGEVYETTATVEDKTDIYESLIRVTAKQSSTNRMYWILYATVYSENGEHDALLGPISEVAPASPTAGAYWYKIDTTNYTVTLMKYSGTAWATTTDTQELLYDWFLFKDATDMITLGAQSKVKIITANDFSRVCSVQCNIFDSDYTLFSRSSQVLNDPSDPIVSTTEPLNPIDKQLWIKIADNGTYIISIWDEATKEWMVSEADSQNKVHVEKPTVYSAGDIWIVGGDYQPVIYTSGVAQTTKHLVGTMLKAQFVSSTYSDRDWVEALNYKERIDDLTEQLNIYNQFFDFDDTGLTMGAKNLSGQISEFKTKLTNAELGFYQGENKVAYINNNQLNISKAEINQSLSIVGTSPILSVGGFSFVVESNGSLSIVTNN